MELKRKQEDESDLMISAVRLDTNLSQFTLAGQTTYESLNKKNVVYHYSKYAYFL